MIPILFLITAAHLTAADPDTDPERLLRDGSAARWAENYETAVRLWRRGEELFPNDVRFPAALADLFYEKKLYNLAARSYERARGLRPLDLEYALRLSETYGLLNRDLEAVAVLKDILPHHPDDWDILQSLAWLLFKTEALTEGVDLLESAIRRLGTNASAEMTLGTLYASLYEYDRSKAHYLRSIEIGRTTRSRLFSSIAWYNLSILENTFLRHDLALEAIQRSLEYAPRASSLLALGEMYQRRGDYELARLTFEEAAAKDETPLALMNLARLYLLVGDPDTAADYLRQVERHPDPSWIYNFGLREEDWTRDLHESWAEVSEARLARNAYRPRLWPWEWVSWLVDQVVEYFRAWSHRERWRNLSWKSASHSGSQNNLPAMLWKQYRSFQGYEWPGIKYLRKNREHDEPKIPGIGAFYDMRQALDLQDTTRVLEALPRLHPVWDASLRQEAWAFLVRSGFSEYAEPLWAQNPGLLLVNARPLGFSLQDPEGLLPWWQRVWGGLVGLLDDRSPWTLRLARHGEGLRWSAQTRQKSREGFVPAERIESGAGLPLLLETHRLLFTPSSSR